MKIVIIDDEIDIGYILCIELKLSGHDAISFAEVDKAKEYVQNHYQSIDVIFCDFQMPQLDGLEFFNWSRNIKYEGPFYILTGEPNMDVQSLLKSGITQVLFKPQDLMRIQEILKP